MTGAGGICTLLHRLKGPLRHRVIARDCHGLALAELAGHGRVGSSPLARTLTTSWSVTMSFSRSSSPQIGIDPTPSSESFRDASATDSFSADAWARPSRLALSCDVRGAAGHPAPPLPRNSRYWAEAPGTRWAAAPQSAEQGGGGAWDRPPASRPVVGIQVQRWPGTPARRRACCRRRGAVMTRSSARASSAAP